MTALVKRIEIDREMADILDRSTIYHLDGTQEWLLKLPQQLERPLYERVNKVIEASGGKWSRKTKVHVFTYDPCALVTAVDAGELQVVKEGWFPTPAGIVWQMLDLAPWQGGDILEPSAGEGAIAEVIRGMDDAELYLLCIEKNAQRAQTLRDRGHNTLQADFLSYPLPPVFTRIYMNPPFEKGQDIDHVIRAFGLLAPGGELVSIMSEGVFHRQDRKAKDFRAILDLHDWDDFPLPEHAFKESGTSVRARIVHLKNED